MTETLFWCALQAKQFELHFTVGEGLVFAALGPTASVARDPWTQSEAEFTVRDKLSSSVVRAFQC